MILKWSVFLILTFFHSHTFHLNQPSGTAYRSMNKYFRSMWETFVIHCFNNCIVGYVTQIYNHLSQIFKRAVRFFQQYIYHKNKGTYKVAQVDAALYTSWISGYYYFHEENLEGILARLGNIYGVSFRLQSDKLKERRFTGTFYRGQSIKDILDIINISIPIRYSINNRQVTIN